MTNERTPSAAAHAIALSLKLKPWEVVPVALALDDFRAEFRRPVGEDTIEAGGCAPPILAGHVPVREEVAAAIHQTMKRQRAARAAKSREPKIGDPCVNANGIAGTWQYNRFWRWLKAVWGKPAFDAATMPQSADWDHANTLCRHPAGCRCCWCACAELGGPSHKRSLEPWP